MMSIRLQPQALRILWLPLFFGLVVAGAEMPRVSAQDVRQKLPVRMRLEPLSIRGRSGSPIPLQIKLEYNQSQILEGDLLLEIYNSVYSADDLMASIRYDGIVLQGTDFFFNTILPPLEHSYNQQYLIVAWFETAEKRIPLTADPDLLDPPEPHELLTIGLYERANLICSCSGDSDFLKPSANRLFLNNALSLDNYTPKVGETAQPASGQRQFMDSQRIQNYTVSWDALELPEDPLYLCAFDLVLLADRALGRLDDRQMKALTTWVQAGGSLCVVPHHDRLNGTHLQFLQTLFEHEGDPNLHLSLTDEGELLVIGGQSVPWINRYAGLGRVTLLMPSESFQRDLSAADMGTVVAHLWKVHRDSPVWQGERLIVVSLDDALQQQGLSIVSDERGLYVQGQQGHNRYAYNRYNDREQLAQFVGLNPELQPQPNPFSTICETALMPRGVKMVPTSIIALLLIAYVVAIGPFDYLVLGYFRARKYTWILFPVTTAIFTGVTLWVAHRYMSSTDTGSSVTMIDVIGDGRAVRQTTLEMHFYSAQAVVKEQQQEAFTVPARTLLATQPMYGGNMGQQQPRSIGSGIRYRGRFPQTYETDRQVRQWEPQMIRTMSLAPEDAVLPAVPWNDSTLVMTNAGREKLAQLLTKAVGQSVQEVDALVLHCGERISVFPQGAFFSQGALREGRGWTEMDQWQQRNVATPQDGLIGYGVVQASVVTGTRNYLSLVSQVSPQGSASMEDLPLLDPTDDSQWLLVVLTETDGHFQVYRKLYNADQTKSDL
ncbi:MAG: hypothetical protein KDA81_11750 [Planctomycetaceae bacterium]|nr:hypothetical protein [Planctomycetaceae bacterium]